MARSTRFERVTAGTANQCSIQLSYERISLWMGIIPQKDFVFKGFFKIFAKDASVRKDGELFRSE